jgi:hypothetical protein
VLLAAPAPTRLADRLAPLLYALLVKEPDRRPDHDTIHAALTNAYPARARRSRTVERSSTGTTAAAPPTVERLTDAAASSGQPVRLTRA